MASLPTDRRSGGGGARPSESLESSASCGCHAACCSGCRSRAARSEAVRKLGAPPMAATSATQSVAAGDACPPRIVSYSAGCARPCNSRRFARGFGGSLKRQLVLACLLVAAIGVLVSAVLASPRCRSGSDSALGRCQDEWGGPSSGGGAADSITSLLEVVEERKKSWARSLSSRAKTTPALFCGSALYGGKRADGSVFVDLGEAANCRSICKALLDKFGRACADADDPYGCVLSSPPDGWIPKDYKTHCTYSRPNVQQPDFERSKCSEKCLEQGMRAWLSNTLRGDMSWSWFVENISSSCRFKSIGVEVPRLSPKAQKDFSSSSALKALKEATLRQFNVITRKVRRESAHLAESTIVPADYWSSLGAAERTNWTVTKTFFAPTDESKIGPLLQQVYGLTAGKAICLFRRKEAEGERFGMIPGNSCLDSIGVLLVVALAEHPVADFDAESNGFDLCVARRAFQGRLVEDEVVVSPLELKTRVTIGTPCGFRSKSDDSMWEVAFYASLYPQANGIDGLPSGGDCPWKGSFQLNSKCFFKAKSEAAGVSLDFFSANAACRELTEGTGFPAENASLATIDNDRELKFAGEMLSEEGQSWIGLFQPEQLPLVFPGRSEAYRLEEADCPAETLQSADGLGSRLSTIISRCQAARKWPAWKSLIACGTSASWDALFCEMQPQTRDAQNFADCASIKPQPAGPPCLTARSCDAPIPFMCSLKLWTDPPLVLSEGKRTSGLPVLSCKPGDDCWLVLATHGDERTGNLVTHSSMGSAFTGRSLALMTFCGAGSILAGPWPEARRTNIGNDSQYRGLEEGMYEICSCSQVLVGDTIVSCTAGKEFSHLRGILRRFHGKDSSVNSSRRLEVSLEPLAGAAGEDATISLSQQRNEISAAIVYCNVDSTRRIDSMCKLKLQGNSSNEQTVKVSFVPVSELLHENALCSDRGITVSANVKGQTEVQVPSFVPSSLKYAICADGSLLGTLITSGLEVIFPDEQINNAYFNMTVSGYHSESDAKDAVLALEEAESTMDTSCPEELLSQLTGRNRYHGEYLKDSSLLVLKFPAPPGLMKMCLVNARTSQYPTIVRMGVVPLTSTPEKIMAAEARCSFSPRGDCAISLYPDPRTESISGSPFFSANMTIKLLKGTTGCPSNPNDSSFNSFSGDPADISALLSASAVAMTQTYADSTMVEFTLEKGLRRWLADAGIASICMTHDGFSSSYSTCSTVATCTAFLGYMRWTADCVVDVHGKNMNFLDMNFSRLAALDACGKLTGEGTLLMVGAFEGVNLSKLSDSSFLEMTETPGFSTLELDMRKGSNKIDGTSSSVSYLVQNFRAHGSFELCWNPAAGSSHNLLDHTISVGRVLLTGRNILESLTIVNVKAEKPVANSLQLSVKSPLSHSELLGSTKLYFKSAPESNTNVDTCDFEKDVAADVITALISASDVETKDDYRVGFFVARNPSEKTSVCLVHFTVPSDMSNDMPLATYLGRLPGDTLPSANLTIICSVDNSLDCQGQADVAHSPALDYQGHPLSFTSSLPVHVEGVAVSSASCPSDPEEIRLGISDKDELLGERLTAEFTEDHVKVSIDRMSLLLALSGKATLCLVDASCVYTKPQHGKCVSTLGTALWAGPSLLTHIASTCTSLKAGLCEVTVPGFRMTTLNYGLPRLAVAEKCGDSDTKHWGLAVMEAVENDATVFGVPAMPTGKLRLCWNPYSLLPTGEGSTRSAEQVNMVDFKQDLGEVQFLPFPTLKSRSISRQSATSATVIVEVDALLDKETANLLGIERSNQGIWNRISKARFTDGQECTVDNVYVQLRQTEGVIMKEEWIRDREEGSAEESGSRSTNSTVAVFSLEIVPEVQPFTYCWHSVITGSDSQVLRESWTPLISLSPPSEAQLGGTRAELASSLGFVPCSLGTEVSGVCNFSVVPTAPEDVALFPHGTPWILPTNSTVILLPGDVECPDVPSDTFHTATAIDSPVLDPHKPLQLTPEEPTQDFVWYQFGAAKSWLSENVSATICWGSNDIPGKAVKIAQALWLGPLYDRTPMKVKCPQTAVCKFWVHGKNLAKLDHSFSRVAILEQCGQAKGPGAARMRSTSAGSASFITFGSSSTPNLLTANNLEPVHFWALPGKVFHTRCKHGTSPEFQEAYWLDARGICSRIDVTSLLNAHCRGSQRCFSVLVGSRAEDAASVPRSALHLLIPDECDDKNFRKLLGTYSCVDRRVFDEPSLPLRENIGLPAMLQLSVREDDVNDNSLDYTEATETTDQSISYWIEQSGPGLYEICWNPSITRNLDPSAFSEFMGTLEMLPVTAVVDEAVVCRSEGLDSCTFEITIETDAPVDATRTVGLVVAEQDGLDSCKDMSWEEAQSLAVMPHQSSWNSANSRNALTYTISLPVESTKLCVVMVNNKSEAGTLQYVGNTPGYSAPKEHKDAHNICTADPAKVCKVTLVAEAVSTYFVLDNRNPIEDESAPSFDAFDQLRPYLQESSKLYGLAGDVSCPSNPADKTYQQSDMGTDSGAIQLLNLTTNLSSFDYEVTDEQKKWLSEVVEVTLCWVVPACVEDPVKNGTRPCTRKVGLLSWAGPDVEEPLPTINCRLDEPCSFVVQGLNMSLLNHERSRVAFLHDCGAPEGPGIGRVTEYPSGSTRLGVSQQQLVLLALKSRFAKHWKGSMDRSRYRADRRKRLEGMLSLLQTQSWEAIAIADRLTVAAPSPVEGTVSVCWNPLLVPTENLTDFTIIIGKIMGYGIVRTDKLCTSGSTCGVEINFKGTLLDPTSLKIRAFAGQCGLPSGVPDRLPNEGVYVEGHVYSFGEPIPFRNEEIETFKLCWCDEVKTSECDVSDYLQEFGSLEVQNLKEETPTCLKHSKGECKVSLPVRLTSEGSPSHVYVAEFTSSTPMSCTNALSVFPITKGVVSGDSVTLSLPYSALESAGLHDKAIAICWTRQEDPLSSPVPVWNSSFLGNVVLLDPHVENCLYSGLPVRLIFNVTGLVGSQASEDGLPESLRKLYIKDQNKCSSDKTTISTLLVKDQLQATTGKVFGTTQQIRFVSSEAVHAQSTNANSVVPQFSVCWCNAGGSCASATDFKSEVTKVPFFGPAGGVMHQCTHDSTCLMSIQDIPSAELRSYTPQLLIRENCAEDTEESKLPDQGMMSLRTDTLHPSAQQRENVLFEEHSYGFNSRILREQTFADTQQLRKRICYCTDSSDCSAQRRVDIGEITITDVWDTTFRIAIAQQVKVPFSIKSPLHQGVSQREVRVVRGSYAENCALQAGNNICTISLRSFPEETWSSAESAVLEYYDSSIPLDSLDGRPIPFVQLANLLPTGPWKNDYQFFCYLGGECEITVDIVNAQPNDKVALLPLCGQKQAGAMGLSQVATQVGDSDKTMLFQWSKTLNLTEADVRSGLEVCWKEVEAEGAPSDAITAYSTKFGTLSVRAIFPNQDRACYVGSHCKAEALRYQYLEAGDHVKLLQTACGSEGTEWNTLPNGGIMSTSTSTDSLVDDQLTLFLSGPLPVLGIASLKMCACTKPSCTLKEEFSFPVGELSIKGPFSTAPLVSGFLTEAIHISWEGDFDDKFYVVLKGGTTCAADAPSISLHQQGFSPVFAGSATWTSQDLGLLSVCMCHDTVAGLSDPFDHPHQPATFCEDRANFAAKVGQLFVSGPLTSTEPLSCRTGAVCHVTIRWMAMDSEEVRDMWAKSRVYAQTESCSVVGTPVLSGAVFTSDDKVGETMSSADPDYSVNYHLRESVFIFPDPVEVAAGRYNMCWAPEGGNAGVSLGTFNVDGPLTRNTVIPVANGQKFDIEVEMSFVVTSEQASSSRIRAFSYRGDAIFADFDCKAQLGLYIPPDSSNCKSFDGPPSTVKTDGSSSTLVWKDVCVIVDELTAEEVAGDKFAVCFCDGQDLGCEAADRFRVLVQAWALTGPKPLERDVQPRYRAGARFSLDINGVDLQQKAVIGFSPAFSLHDNARYTCRSPGKDVLGASTGIVSEDGTKITFTDVQVPFTISQGLLCWCPGDSCSNPADFAVQLGRFGVAGPTFILLRTVVGNYFTVQLIGSSLHRNDAITIRSLEARCGDPGTEQMDPDLVMEEADHTLNSLGKVESFSASDNPLTGEKEMTWTSWGMRIKETKERLFQICYCSSTVEDNCGAPGTLSVQAGLLEVRGPAKGDIELVASEEHGEYLVVRGTNLSTKNLLRYFQYPADQGAPSAAQEAAMCSNPINQQGGVITFPDAVNADGTEQYFSVAVATGKQYVACWSFGEGATSVASSMTRQRMAPSFLGIEELLHTPQEESAELKSAEEALTKQQDESATEQPTTGATSPDPPTMNFQKWFFLSVFSQKGFQQGIHTVVVGYEDLVVVNGVINATDTYNAILGKSHEMSDCTAIYGDLSLQSDIALSTVSVTETRIVLQMQAATQVGWHKLCIKHLASSTIFNAGTVEVASFFQKTGLDMFDTRRTFVLPCVTAVKNDSGDPAWTESQVWLPDGTGLWTAKVVSGEPGSSKPYSTLKVDWPPQNNFRRFPQLRNVLACDTTKSQAVLVLGATHMLVMYPDKAGKQPVLINHGVPYPADVTSAGDQVFITSFDSHLITSFSLSSPEKIIFYEPFEPTLLSAGGIQAIQNIDGDETSIFVADTVGGMIGRLLISPDDLRNTAKGEKITRPWTAVFGKQKSDFRNADGVNRPFCVGEFVTPYSTQEKMNSLLLVGELITDRITFLSLDNKELSFYRQINLGLTKFITGLRVVDDVMLLTSKQWSVEQDLGRAEVIYVTFSQLIDNVYFTYPDFTRQLQAGLRYRFLPLVTGQEIQFFKEDAEAGDPLDSMGFTLDSKTGEIQGTLTATVTSRVVIVGGDLLGSYTWSFEFEAGCQSGEYFRNNSNKCEACPLGTFRDEETELQTCWDYKPHSTTLQTGSTNLSQCACIEGYEIGHLGTCQPCPAGTYKSIVADSKCTGRCPQHMSSDKTGAASLDALNCHCDPGFYLAEDGCQSCQVGSYCAGNLSPPVRCPAFQTTAGPASSSPNDCVCTAGHYRQGEDCVPCGVTTYKPLIGDHACTACPQPAASAAASQHILASSSPELAMFSSRKGAIQQSECEVCASGFYFDSVSVGGCVPCKKDYFCPGFQLGLMPCRNSSVTSGLGAESLFQCGCPRGYGRSSNRSPLDLSLTCTPCPFNHFQPVEGADTECIPCPANSMTKTTMSKSITSCVAMPGFSAVENLQALTNNGIGGIVNNGAAPSFLEAIELAKDVEKAYEALTEDDFFAISVFCKEGDTVASYDMAEFVSTMYTSTFRECQNACLKNVYCTSFSFSREDSFPTHTISIMNHTGIYPYEYWPCHLYMFGAGATADVRDWADLWRGTEVDSGKAVGCVVGRVTEELTWQRFRYVECPPNAYCPGDREAAVVECKDYAVTLGPRAYSAEHCLCVPGYGAVGHACEQCSIGYYKNTTENVACTECPQFYTTSITASTSAYECACQPGMYMASANSTESKEGDEVLEEASSSVLTPAAVETMTQARSLRELGKHGELPSTPSEEVSMAELLRLPWLEEDSRQELEKVVDLGMCVPCHKGMFCPGLWQDTPANSTHMPPQQCIEGSSVPLSTVNADSVEKCLCLEGYAYGRSSEVTAVSSDSYFTCSKCAPGTYKELQENAPCSGRCMKDAETFPGAVSKSQCFCQVGRYAVESDNSEGLFSCVECVRGGVCIGGLKENVIKKIEENPRYANITISDHTIPYPQKGWFATFKPVSQELWSPANSASIVDSVSDDPGILDSDASTESESDALDASVPEEEVEGGEGQNSTDEPTSFLEADYDRIPDIHACPIDYRCLGGPTNSCAEGGTGYLCGKCKPGYDVAHHATNCSKCGSILMELLELLVSRLVVCILLWIVAAVSCLAVQNPACIHPILIRIWLSNFFLFFLFGYFPQNSTSALVEWGSTYRAVFASPVFLFTRYPRIFCILEQLGFPVEYKKAWYLQKFAQLLMPVADILILTLICGGSLVLYKIYKYSKIERVKLVLKHAREVHAGDVWAMRTVQKIQDTRCLGLFHYISPPDATFGQEIRRFFGDLVPAFMIIWFWNLPFLVIECTKLLGCVVISYKDEPGLVVLTALPEQICSLSDPWFLAGVIVGASGILVWGIGSIIVFSVWMIYTNNADNLESRFRYGFLSNGYEFQYRAWEMLLMARKLACACLLTLQLQMSASGTQEIFRNSINLLIATTCLILQLLIEPYDRRSHNLANRVEYFGLLTNVVNCIIIQGSFSFSGFKWLGPLPIITCGLFHAYIFWSLFVEAGRMVLMRPHLARLPSPWRYFNLVTRSLARLYTRGNAKVYYNYITKEMVLEAAAKSRVFHIRRLIQKKKKNNDYMKINYENRTYFVSALTDSLSRLVICWCQFTIPGDWLDFTIRYSFCYCFWMRHRAASSREPLDLEEFDALRPSLFNECYVETEDGDDDGLFGSETECNEVEAEFLDMMVDDDVYDDSPITLMELYIAVHSMRYIPKGQLRRLHMWYRERMAAAAGSDIPALRKENEELEAELQQLGEVLRNRFGAADAQEPSFSVLDFFFTVEMVHEAEEETIRLKKEIDKKISDILSARAARAVAEKFHRELEKTEAEDLEEILKSVEDDIAERQEKEKERMERTEYLEPALLAAQKKVKTRAKPARSQEGEVMRSMSKRRMAPLASKRNARVNLPEERKRIRRPNFASAAGRSDGRVRPVAEQTNGSFGRTLSPLGRSSDESDAGSRAPRRRISLKPDGPCQDKTSARRISLSITPEVGADSGSEEKPARRISLSITPEVGADSGSEEKPARRISLCVTPEVGADSGSKESSAGVTRRTLKVAAFQTPQEDSSSSGTPASSKRTLSSASLQKFSESPPTGEQEEERLLGRLSLKKASRVCSITSPSEESSSAPPKRRTLSPLPSTVRPDSPVGEASGTEAQPPPRRKLGRIMKQDESEEDKA
ncbi:hypothetical protein Efla_004931 [Eimeria flavescens]